MGDNRASLSDLGIGKMSPKSRETAWEMLKPLNSNDLTVGQQIDACLMVLTSSICHSSEHPKSIAILSHYVAGLVPGISISLFLDEENRRAMGMNEEIYQQELAEVELEVMQRQGGEPS